MSAMVWPWLLVHVESRFGLPACCSMQPAHMVACLGARDEPEPRKPDVPQPLRVCGAAG